MAARVGIQRDDVLAVAVELLDEVGEDALSLGAVARRLGIRTQSLYAHVDGADGLRRVLAVHGLERLRDETTAAALGVDGVEAVAGVIRAHLAVASASPALYDVAIHPPGTDPELVAAVAAAGTPLQAVLAGCGLDGDDVTHWTRLMLSSVAGYARLRARGRFALPVDDDETEDRLVSMLVAALPARASG
ncbi:MAG: WHG domain-containing protein [Actinomycetota bacterium]